MPSLRFLTLEPAERHRLTFPVGWDLTGLEGWRMRPWASGLADLSSFESKLYGGVRLPSGVTELRGVTKDLTCVPCNHVEVTDDVLTQAYYPHLADRSLSRLHRRQRSVKVPAAHELAPSRLTRFTQSVTHGQVTEFFRLKNRAPAQRDLPSNVLDGAHRIVGNQRLHVHLGHGLELADAFVYPTHGRTRPGLDLAGSMANLAAST